MKILYLSHRIPYPPNKGDKIRSFNEVKYLSKKHEIHLGCLCDNPDDGQYIDELENYCQRVCVVPLNTLRGKIRGIKSLCSNKSLSAGYFYSTKLQKTINQWLESETYDAVMCFSSPMAEYLFRSPVLKNRFTHSNKTNTNNSTNPTGSIKPTLIMDFCDLDSDKWAQYATETRFPANLLYKIESRQLLKYEKKINKRYDFCVFISEQEADLFLSQVPGARNIEIIPNGIDHTFFASQVTEIKPDPFLEQQIPVLLFVGAMDYYPNIDGIMWFHKNIFPLIMKQFPNVRLYIVGHNPPSSLLELNKEPNIVVTGFVEDIRPYYQAADLSVMPLRIARGIQNKVLEAMAMNMPVVTTSKALEGIQAANGEHVMVEDEPEPFSNAVCDLLKDKEKSKEIGQKARSFVMENFNWENILKKFDNLIETR